MQFLRARFTMRRLMVIVAFAGLALASINLIYDPLEEFHRRTGLRRPMVARVLTYGGGRDFRLVFDADQDAIAEWLSWQPAGDWRGWHSGHVPSYASSCQFASDNFQSFPIKNPESTSVHFAVRDSPIDHDYSGLIVIDQTIGRVWFGSWSLR
jgi:hypothetical protein